MSTFAAVATRAMSGDIDASWQTDVQTAVIEAVQLIYRTTSLARGGLMIAATTAIGAYTITGLSLVVGGSIHLALMGDNGEQVPEVDPDTLKQLQLAQPNTQGRPRCFAVITPASNQTEAPTIEVWPKANAVYTLWFSGTEELAAADFDNLAADQVPLPSVYERLLVYYARAEHFDFTGDFEAASIWRGKWDAGAKELRSDLQRRPVNRVVPGTWSNLQTTEPTFHYGGLF